MIRADAPDHRPARGCAPDATGRTVPADSRRNHTAGTSRQGSAASWTCRLGWLRLTASRQCALRRCRYSAWACWACLRPSPAPRRESDRNPPAVVGCRGRRAQSCVRTCRRPRSPAVLAAGVLSAGPPTGRLAHRRRPRPAAARSAGTLAPTAPPRSPQASARCPGQHRLPTRAASQFRRQEPDHRAVQEKSSQRDLTVPLPDSGYGRRFRGPAWFRRPGSRRPPCGCRNPSGKRRVRRRCW